MAEFPKLPLWTDAYLGDTTHLTTIEHGAYLLLLIAMWRSKGTRLPNDDKLLARYARLTAGQWARIKPVIMPFFTVEGDIVTQSRLTDEANAVRQHSAKQSDKAKARHRKDKEKIPAAAVPEPCRNDASLSLSLSHTDPSSDGSERGALPLALGDPEPPKPKPKSRRKPEVPIPEDWAPSDRNIADAQSRNLSPEDIRREADRFRDHHLAKGTLFRDWDAGWRYWVSRARPGGGGVVVAAFPGRGGSGRSLASIAAQRRLADAN